MLSAVFSCYIQHATYGTTPKIFNSFSTHLEFATHDLMSTRTLILCGPYHQCLSLPYPITLLIRTVHTVTGLVVVNIAQIESKHLT